MSNNHTEKKFAQLILLCCLCSLLLQVNCFHLPEADQLENEILDSEGVVIQKTPIWEADVSDEDFIWVSVIPIFHNNTVIVPGSPRRDAGMLVALDTATGKEVWRWNDYVDGYDFVEILSREQLNSKENLVIYNNNNRFCAVNLDNGTTLWKEKRPGSSSYDAIQIIGNHYYYPYELDIENNGANAQVLMKGDLFSSDHEMIVELPIDTIQLFGSSYGSLYQLLMYEENNKVIAFLPFSENLDIYKGQSLNSFITYDVSSQRFTGEKVRLSDTTAVGIIHKPVKIREVYVVSIGDYIYGINEKTMEVIWIRRRFVGELSSGNFKIASYKDRLFAVNHIGWERLVMELEPETGNTKWIDKGNGGSTRPALYFLNNVLYFVSRGDGRLYAYDINSGKMLWKLKSPDHEGFMTMQVHKAKNAQDQDMLVACSWKNAYRFEPAK